MLNKALITLTLLTAPLLSFAQVNRNRVPIDTVSTPKGVYILYTNQTWDYLPASEVSKIRAAQAGNEDSAPAPQRSITPGFDMSGSVFERNWAENSLAAYHTSLADLPSNIFIRLADVEDTTSFHCPYKGPLSSRYGYRDGRRHTGSDIPLKIGDAVYAAFDGKVRVSNYNPKGYGNLVIIRHANGLETYYAHLSSRMVEAGQEVKSGQVIGLGGSTGRSTGPHLHFEVRYEGFPFDPERIINFPAGTLRSYDFDLRKSYFGANSRYGASGNYTPRGDEDDETLSDADPGLVKKKTPPAPPKPKAVYHTVKSGDNLSKIAKKYGTTIQAICKLNKIDAKKPLQQGKKLRVK